MKNLKFLFTSLVIIVYINSIKSQEKLIVNSNTSEECLQNLSIFAESAKVKNYNEAKDLIDSWIFSTISPSRLD